MISEENNAVFDERYVIVSESGCWIWTGWQVGSRYGKFWLRGAGKGGKHVLAHRYSYARFVGEIPDGACVCHRCDVPLCVNPDHLWIGTHGENMADMALKGRNSPPKQGQDNHSAKLTDSQALAIFQAPGRHRDIAARFGIHATTVDRIKRGTTWRHITQNLAKANSAPGGSRHSIAQNRQSDKGKTQ